MFISSEGLQRVRDEFLTRLNELIQSKPRNKVDDNLISEITRLESALAVAKDELVRC